MFVSSGRKMSDRAETNIHTNKVKKKLEKEGRPGSSERRIRKMFTFDVVLFDCRAAVG